MEGGDWRDEMKRVIERYEEMGKEGWRNVSVGNEMVKTVDLEMLVADWT